jgi:hypothetical protein
VAAAVAVGRREGREREKREEALLGGSVGVGWLVFNRRSRGRKPREGGTRRRRDAHPPHLTRLRKFMPAFLPHAIPLCLYVLQTRYSVASCVASLSLSTHHNQVVVHISICFK